MLKNVNHPVQWRKKYMRVNNCQMFKKKKEKKAAIEEVCLTGKIII